MDLTELAKLIFSEYGALVTFLLVSNAMSLGAVKLLWDQVKFLNNKFLEVIQNNTQVMTQIAERLEDHH